MDEPSRADALEAALAPVPDGVTVVFANGYLAREGFRIRPTQPDFHMLGSMGLASSIGAGLVARRPDRPVVVVEGDGNLLMGLAALPAVSAIVSIGTLVHVVIDDGAYASTGGQATYSRTLDLSAAALALGYRSARTVTDLGLVPNLVAAALAAEGPHLVRLLVTTDGEPPSPRVSREPAAIARLVSASYASSNSSVAPTGQRP
jgi:thiamine pyrophosphate-dependent acetolactate synthase large subunit-like protein